MLHLLQNYSKIHVAISKSIAITSCSLFPASQKCVRSYSGNSSMKVTVIGAAGRIGQPLSLMLKQSPLIDELCVYDVKDTCAFAMELGHVDTRCTVSSYSGKEIMLALQNSKVVVVVAADNETEANSHAEKFKINAKIVKGIAEKFAQFCPRALLAIATTPVNSLVPLANEVVTKLVCDSSKSIMGITSVDVVRTNTFVAEVQGLEPECVVVPVIGGSSKKTIVPVLSQARPCAEFTNEELEKITSAVQKAHEDLVDNKVKDGGSLASAFAIARFVISLVKGLRGFKDVVECAYVRSDSHSNSKYLATPVQLGPVGVMKNHGVPPLTEFENCLLEAAVNQLKKDIKAGELFVGVQDPPPCDPCDPDPSAPICPPDWCEKQAKERKPDCNV